MKGGDDTMTIERIDPGPRMSDAVACGNLIFTAGQVAEKPLLPSGMMVLMRPMATLRCFGGM